MSGSKISFLNSSSINGNKLYDQNGERLFSPKINTKSQLMSPRDRETTFHMLYQQAINQKKKHEILAYKADRDAQIQANQGVLENVNDKSEEFLVKQFYNEFCHIIQN